MSKESVSFKTQFCHGGKDGTYLVDTYGPVTRVLWSLQYKGDWFSSFYHIFYKTIHMLKTPD